MTSIKDKRQTGLLRLFTRVEKSGLSVKKYFATHQTPISTRQYFRLRKRIQEQDEPNLVDQRHLGNARKLSDDQLQMVRGVLTYNRHLSSAKLQVELRQQWNIKLSRGRINQLRQGFDLTRIKPKASRQEPVELAGIEVFSALAHHIGILQHWNMTIHERLQQVQQTDLYGDGRNTGDHVEARRRDGTFSPRYNRLADVRHMKFSAIADKIKDKDFSRLSLYETTPAIIDRKESGGSAFALGHK